MHAWVCMCVYVRARVCVCDYVCACDSYIIFMNCALMYMV